MRLKILVTTRIYHQLFIIVLLLRNSVSGQIDWAEDEDDPGKIFKFILVKLNDKIEIFPQNSLKSIYTLHLIT